MTSIDHEELFEQYYQKKYDFNTSSLTDNEIADIKRLAREKRVDYALAPLGTGVFDWICDQNKELRIEPVPFDSDNIDGMLFIPTTGQERAYIILNSNKPLANQIFAAAHEFYHYIRDYQIIKERPYICDFSMLKDINEKKACRFAAELLLPEEALAREIQDYCLGMEMSSVSLMSFYQFSTIIIYLTVKYQLPLKAVIYRLAEEHYIENVDRYIKDYGFIKSILREIKILGKRVEELYSNENKYLTQRSSIYQDITKAYNDGNASREEILRDATVLGLDMALVEDIVSDDTIEDDTDEDDDELLEMLKIKREEMHDNTTEEHRFT